MRKGEVEEHHVVTREGIGISQRTECQYLEGYEYSSGADRSRLVQDEAQGILLEDAERGKGMRGHRASS